ncbi:MAG TPA: hypothetical protein VGG03_01305 [Thermoanaerobaculia bacterium]|jgi:hypothetical protein
MNTGYNTDVRHGEVVFHVQTEDKGVANPYIESLVYVGGQVLASKRASYADLLAEGKDEKEEIVALMKHQHQTMIAAIRHGKLDARLASLNAGRQTGQHAAFEAPAPAVKPATGRVVPPPAPAPPPVPPPARTESGETVARSSETVARGATMAPPPVPAAARPAAPPRPAGPDRTLDQVILEYLTSEADQEQLVLMLEDERDLTLGRRATLALRTSSSKTGQPVAGAQVSVRMISTVLEPRVLAAGRTDERGRLTLGFDIPQLNRGTSALIVNAVSAIGRAELKHLL